MIDSKIRKSIIDIITEALWTEATEEARARPVRDTEGIYFLKYEEIVEPCRPQRKINSNEDPYMAQKKLLD